MDRALELAGLGWGRVAPNPLVGAVLLRDGVVLGEGYHGEFGWPHAETVALSQVSDPSGATCVVTLEPCAHHGKTPPCVDALIRAGVARVVIAVPDPHPKASGGAAKLRGAGIDVEMGLGQEAAAALNAPFLFNATNNERPFLAVKMATSLDGFIADESGASQWVSGAESRAFVQWLRAGFDAIGVGARTAMQDDPQLTVRGPLQPRTPPMRVVFSKTGALRATLRVVDTDTGTQVTEVPLGRALLIASPALVGEVLYFGTDSGEVISLDWQRQETRWIYSDPDQPNQIYSSPAVTDEVVIIGSRDRRVHCIDRATGERRWVFETRGWIDGSPVVVGDRVFFGSNDRNLYAVNIEDGSEAWQYQVGQRISGSPAVGEGYLVIAADDRQGRILCFGTP